MAENFLFVNLRFRPSIRKGGNYVKEVQTKKISLLKNIQIRVDGELHHTPVTAASYRLVAQSVDKRQV